VSATLDVTPPRTPELEVVTTRRYPMAARDASDIVKIDDPAERARRATTAIAELTARVQQLSEVRRDAVAELRRTYTQREVAARLGISQARVNQLEHEQH